MAAILLLAFVTLQRLSELWLSRRNTMRLHERGAVEVAPGHYPLIVALHTIWLGSLWFAGPGQDLNTLWLAAFAVLQVLRFWVLSSLGGRWTTRILILPGERLVTTGPYRFFAHPNYAVVVGEIAVLPLALGLPWHALIFSILNAGVLFVRLRAENAALATLRIGSRATQPPQARP